MAGRTGAGPADYARAILVNQHAAAITAELEVLNQVLSRTPLLKQIIVDAATRPDDVHGRTIDRYLTAFSEPVRELVATLSAERTIDYLPELTRRAAELLKARQQVVAATVETPIKLTPSLRAELEKELAQPGRELVLHERIRRDLIGGLRVIINDRVIDRSVGGGLRQLEGQLAHG